MTPFSHPIHFLRSLPSSPPLFPLPNSICQTVQFNSVKITIFEGKIKVAILNGMEVYILNGSLQLWFTVTPKKRRHFPTRSNPHAKMFKRIRGCKITEHIITIHPKTSTSNSCLQTINNLKIYMTIELDLEHFLT